MQEAPVLKDIVLLGGGHSHIAVLRSFGMQAIAGVRLTLISREIETAYSGMLPGMIAGHYTSDEGHIDLVPLAQFAGARFIKDDIIGINADSQTVLLSRQPPIPYDVLSINVGSTPCTDQIDGLKDNIIPVKPINQFLNHWGKLKKRITAHSENIKIGIIGGGFGGVELTLAIHHFIVSSSLGLGRIDLTLITADEEILKYQTKTVVRRFRRLLAERGIQIRTSTQVTGVRPGKVISGELELDFDEVLWVTQAGAPPWLKTTGLELDAKGFILINNHLQSLSKSNIFAVGDVATMADHPRPKAGVFAVRQAPILIKNLRASLLGGKMSAYQPQKQFLKLISTGSKSAIATRGSWSTEGRWVWHWKHWIDTRFIGSYQTLPKMQAANDPARSNTNTALLKPTDAAILEDGMRCGGCSAKVGFDVLTEALKDLPLIDRDDVIVGLTDPDDAALISVPDGKFSVLSVDAFRPMVSDPYLFGRITANHCLGDLYAMGAEPQSAMAIVTLPLWPEKKLINELRQMLLGALQTFNTEGVSLVGGHTSEGLETTLGFSVTGLIDKNIKLLRKTSVQLGDSLILTKSLGTGTLLAANMRAQAKGRWISEAINSMLMSNYNAGVIMQSHGANACTDITGFGLAGHLIEMLKNSQNIAVINMNELPLIEGALETLKLGILSTLHPNNQRFAQQIENSNEACKHASFPVLFDPQTAGGLLGTIPAKKADACLSDLIAQGYESSRIIGTIVEANSTQKISLIT